MRSQPKFIRSQYAFAISSLFTGFVALIWFFNQTPTLTPTPISVEGADTINSTFFNQVVDSANNQAALAREAWDQVLSELDAEQGTTSAPVSTTSAVAVPAPDFVLTADNLNQVQARLSEVATATPESMPLGTAPNQPTTNETPPAGTNLTENETNRPSARPVQIIITNNNQVATTTTTP